ncbi:MAG: hypothetical protein QXU67_05870 [Candidatus Bathyarchaeia archaeon]
MTVPPPPPPMQPYGYVKVRPSIVTKWALFGMLIPGIIVIILSAYDLHLYYNVDRSTYLLAIGVICIIIGIYAIICAIGMLAGQKWSLKISGATIMEWTKRPEVRDYFGLPPVYPAYPPAYMPGAPPPYPPTAVPPSQPTAPTPPMPPSAPPAPSCPTCGQPLTFVAQYNRWYCQNEKKYV